MDQPVDAFARNLPKKAVPVDLNTAEGQQCPLCSTVYISDERWDFLLGVQEDYTRS